MTHIIIRHKVADFDRWKPVYDAHQTARENAGLKVLHLWCNEDDPNEVFILFEASDVDKAKELISSADLKESMQDAGVQGPPDIVFLSEK
jgi:hypothetical protein